MCGYLSPYIFGGPFFSEYFQDLCDNMWEWNLGLYCLKIVCGKSISLYGSMGWQHYQFMRNYLSGYSFIFWWPYHQIMRHFMSEYLFCWLFYKNMRADLSQQYWGAGLFWQQRDQDLLVEMCTSKQLIDLCWPSDQQQILCVIVFSNSSSSF